MAEKDPEPSDRAAGLSSRTTPIPRTRPGVEESGVAPKVMRARKWGLVGVLILSFAGAAVVASPLWIAIAFGCILAISAERPFRWFTKKLRGHKSWAAGLTTLGAGLVVAAGGTIVIAALSNELMKLVAHLTEHGQSGSLSELIGVRPTRALEELGLDTGRLYAWAKGEVEAAASFAASTAALVLRTTSEAILGLVVALLTMYYMLVEGPALAHRIERVLPLEPRHTRAILVEAREVSRTAFVGTIVTAIVQGALAGIGYVLLDVPQAVTWAVATALGSFIPVIGTAIVWVPVALYLILAGHPVRAAIIIVYGIVIITSLADYVIRPRIVHGRGHGHPLLTLIALLGGIEIFGLAGLIIAPIVMSVFVAAFHIYEREIPDSGAAT